jgi:hypothetical protein
MTLLRRQVRCSARQEAKSGSSLTGEKEQNREHYCRGSQDPEPDHSPEELKFSSLSPWKCERAGPMSPAAAHETLAESELGSQKQPDRELTALDAEGPEVRQAASACFTRKLSSRELIPPRHHIGAGFEKVRCERSRARIQVRCFLPRYYRKPISNASRWQYHLTDRLHSQATAALQAVRVRPIISYGRELRTRGPRGQDPFAII